MTDFHLVANQHYKITSFSNRMDPSYRQKLLSMGVMPGAIFFLKRFAPLGNTLLIEINDFCLSLRQNELQCMTIEAVVSQ
jgi:ferrous iron transport protein A